jgi:putative phage-type endonuclease
VTPEQLEMRRTGIGGSEVAAVLGLSHFATPLDVWRAKVEGYTLADSPHLRRGRLLEPAVAAWYAEETGAQLREVGTLRHPTRPLALATPDRLAVLPSGEERLLECKTAGWRAAQEWGEEGTDEVSQGYLLQVVWTLAVTGLQRADVAVLVAGEDFRLYHVARDEELEAMLLEEVEAWWAAHVATGTPPPLDGSESAARWLAARYPSHRAGLLEATPEAERWAQQWRGWGREKARCEENERFFASQLKAVIGEAEGIQGEGWRATWRRNKKGSRVFRMTFTGEESSDEQRNSAEG